MTSQDTVMENVDMGDRDSNEMGEQISNKLGNTPPTTVEKLPSSLVDVTNSMGPLAYSGLNLLNQSITSDPTVIEVPAPRKKRLSRSSKANGNLTEGGERNDLAVYDVRKITSQTYDLDTQILFPIMSHTVLDFLFKISLVACGKKSREVKSNAVSSHHSKLLASKNNELDMQSKLDLWRLKCYKDKYKFETIEQRHIVSHCLHLLEKIQKKKINGRSRI